VNATGQNPGSGPFSGVQLLWQGDGFSLLPMRLGKNPGGKEVLPRFKVTTGQNPGRARVVLGPVPSWRGVPLSHPSRAGSCLGLISQILLLNMFCQNKTNIPIQRHQLFVCFLGEGLLDLGIHHATRADLLLFLILWPP